MVDFFWGVFRIKDGSILELASNGTRSSSNQATIPVWIVENKGEVKLKRLGPFFLFFWSISVSSE